MVNINLATSPDQKKEKVKLGGGLTVSLIVLFVLIALYIGMFFYKKSLDQNLMGLQGDFNVKLNQLKSGDAKDVLDFQNRINESERLIKGDIDSKGLLETLEKSMIPGVYLNSYEFDGETNAMNLGCVTNNFNNVAQQILSFKNSGLFTNVDGGETTFSEQDKAIKFKIVLVPKI